MPTKLKFSLGELNVIYNHNELEGCVFHVITNNVYACMYVWRERERIHI